MKKLLFFYLLIACSFSATAQNYFLGSSADGVYEYYILNATVDRKKNIIEVFSRIKPADGKLPDFRKMETEMRQKANASTDGFDKLGYYRRKVQYSCKERKYRIVQVVYYDMNGKVIDQEERDDKTKWLTIPANTMRETEFNKVCNM